MPDCLEPERVSVKDIPGWATESWDLLWRRPVAFLTASVLYHLVALSVRSIPFFSLLVSILVCYILLLISIKVAESADLKQRLDFFSTYAMVRRSILCLLLLAFGYLCIFFAATVIATLLIPEVPVAENPAAKLYRALQWIGPGQVSFMILYMGTIVTSMWFLAPLLALHELDLRDSRALAKRAFVKNDIVVLVASNLPFFVILVLAGTTEMSLLLSLVMVPLFAIYQYVSYRHVFLGRKQNKPVPAKASAGEAAETAFD